MTCEALEDTIYKEYKEGDELTVTNWNKILQKIQQIETEYIPPGPIKKCQYCGRWGCLKVLCRGCGAVIE